MRVVGQTRMMTTDWFRNTQWTPEIEAAFEARLSRSRWQRGEYLRIQALTLADTHKPEYAEPAIALARRQLELSPTGVYAAGVHATIAKAYITLGRAESAIEAFRCAVRSELARPNVRGYCYIDFAWFVATTGLEAHYEEAIAAMGQNMQPGDLALPSTQYRYFGALALISAEAGDLQNARRMALNALSAASQERGPFWRHPKIGLVREEKDAIRSRLEELSQ